MGSCFLVDKYSVMMYVGSQFHVYCSGLCLSAKSSKEMVSVAREEELDDVWGPDGDDLVPWCCGRDQVLQKTISEV